LSREISWSVSAEVGASREPASPSTTPLTKRGERNNRVIAADCALPLGGEVDCEVLGLLDRHRPCRLPDVRQKPLHPRDELFLDFENQGDVTAPP
jgi:hypothetical protein